MPAWAQPYAQGFLERAQGVADTPYQGYGGETVAGMNPWQTQALTAQAQRGMQGSPVMSQANLGLTGMMGSQPMGATANPMAAGGNPYLTQQIDSAQGDLARNWNTVQKPQWDTAMQRSGSFGNSGIMEANQNAQSDLQRNMGRIGSDMRMQDYGQRFQSGENFAGRNDSMMNQGQNRALSAIGMAPQFAQQDYQDINQMANAGQQYQAQDQRFMDDAFARFNQSRQYPQQQLNMFGNALGQAVGNQGTRTQTEPGPSGASTAVGGAMTGAALYNLLFGKG